MFVGCEVKCGSIIVSIDHKDITVDGDDEIITASMFVSNERFNYKCSCIGNWNIMRSRFY